MNSISVKQICDITGGHVLSDGMKLTAADACNVIVSSVVTNSKEGGEGALFVPLIGEHTDAHDYIPDAYERGSRVCFTSREKRLPGTSDMVYIKVDDTKKALQDLGIYYRNMFGGTVFGITGSVGKTTTKEMVAQTLSASYNVLKTSGNKNSQIGVPLMMLELTNDKEYAVIELGMSDFGEMARLAQIAKPTCGLITNIGVSHIGNLGSKENIRSEKLRITDSFPAEGGVLFVNGEDEMLKDVGSLLPAGKKIEIKTFGLTDTCDYYAENIRTAGEYSDFTFVDRSTGEKEQVTLPVIGNHNILDAVAAIGVAKSLGIEPAKSKRMMEVYRPMNMRGHIENVGDVVLIDDTYNASPDSMKSGLDMVEGIAKTGKKIVVLADVLELGAFSKDIHTEIGTYAATKNIDKLICIGTEAIYIAEGARAAGAGFEIKTYPTNDGVFEEQLDGLTRGDVVYMKGSRGMHLDLLAERLRNRK
ncbi:MAG: UDP-N-acetylmuramoyl-tripeptide--D-alanyl-D-alanine ligase [Lachnospiraceae bacterium]|nr:UDP-N-acetylmuramoyl-tripeptide--D-alanyl-D-alanine ligase [Lachnospiraceae bacterium]